MHLLTSHLINHILPPRLTACLFSHLPLPILLPTNPKPTALDKPPTILHPRHNTNRSLPTRNRDVVLPISSAASQLTLRNFNKTHHLRRIISTRSTAPKQPKSTLHALQPLNRQRIRLQSNAIPRSQIAARHAHAIALAGRVGGGLVGGSHALVVGDVGRWWRGVG